MFQDNFDSFSLLLIQVENRVFVDRCFLFSSFSFFFFWNWREKVILPVVNWKVRLVRGAKRCLRDVVSSLNRRRGWKTKGSYNWCSRGVIARDEFSWTRR